ncbi:ESPR-type extended signal peptide-containing protein [Edwardsiella piscicida]|uniref:ESPR-type extended signal peptide-containing protein n=1 Tax=Edwardsiella piscicida TaxID=1263550 RepID=UPI00370D661B
MNKIFSLKYSNISGGYIAVAEICRGAKKSGRQKRSLGDAAAVFWRLAECVAGYCQRGQRRDPVFGISRLCGK